MKPLMTEHTGPCRTRHGIDGAIAAGLRHARAGGAFVAVWTALLGVTFAASSCAMSLPFRHGRNASPPAAPREAELSEQLLDARAHAQAAPAEAYWPWRIGALYAHVDSVAPAEAALRQSLARDPDYGPALSLYSKLEFEAGRHDDAIHVLEAARARARQASRDLAPELLAGLALHYDAIGRVDLARGALAGIAKPERVATGAATSAVALRDGAPDAAAELARAAVHEQSGSAACQNNYGITLLKAGDAVGARKAFLRAIELDPHRAGPYYNLAILDKYYAFDDAAAARWYARFRARSNDDPDGLADTFGTPAAKDLAEGREP